MEKKEIKSLIRKYQSGTCSAAERQLVEEWYKKLQETGEATWTEEERAIAVQIVESRLLSEIMLQRGTRGGKIFNLKYIRVAAAVLVIAAGTLTAYLFLTPVDKSPDSRFVVAKTENSDVAAPQTQKAMIVLDSGEKLPLDSLSAADLSSQSLSINNGELKYKGPEGGDGAMVYNTLINPRGSQVITVQLSDGSKVWLNVGSSIRYPIAFKGGERRVTVTGEAYFEVAHNARQPFIVSKGAVDIRVLGTIFNVNAYEDEGDMKVTLLEGSVLVKKDVLAEHLAPGQQASVGQRIRLTNNADTDAVLAWKNGFFQFSNAGLNEVLQQLSRWYDVEVQYKGSIPSKKFVGEMERSLSLTQVLKILGKNDVHFELEGKRIIVR